MTRKKNVEEKKRYKVYSYRLSKETALQFKKYQYESGLSWNRFVALLIGNYKDLIK